MSIQKLMTEKSESKKNLLKYLGVRGKERSLGLICGELDIDDDMISGLGFCHADFVYLKDCKDTGNIYSKTFSEIEEDLVGFDFFICNGESKNLQEFLSFGVTPIIYKENCLSSLLQEFNPIKGEGNCFLYDSENKWSIYASLVKYLENYKFPYDNKNLVKNIAQV